jgi:hypothetical protein
VQEALNVVMPYLVTCFELVLRREGEGRDKVRRRLVGGKHRTPCVDGISSTSLADRATCTVNCGELELTRGSDSGIASAGDGGEGEEGNLWETGRP